MSCWLFSLQLQKEVKAVFHNSFFIILSPSFIIDSIYAFFHNSSFIIHNCHVTVSDLLCYGAGYGVGESWIDDKSRCTGIGRWSGFFGFKLDF